MHEADDPTRPAGGGTPSPADAPKKDPARETPAEPDDGALEDGELDEALEETFPASDPLPPPSTPGRD